MNENTNKFLAAAGQSLIGFCLTSLFALTTAWGQANYATPYTFTTIAGSVTNYGSADGTNSDARFWAPLGIITDNNGNLFESDSRNNIVRKITQLGTNWVVTTIATG